MSLNILIIGGGAAGFFTAINAAENYPEAQISIVEKGNEVLQKVKISGGGRCNVTHACFDPKELTTYYPRGAKELLGPFHQFMTGDTMQWFEERGVPLKIEADNRVFPASNSSQTIVDLLTGEAKRLGVEIRLAHRVNAITKTSKQWTISTNHGDLTADKLVITAGSNTKIWNLLAQLGHTIIDPVPSLFTFKINDPRIKEIPGVSVTNATVQLVGHPAKTTGPVLITHWGLSGPAILKLSAIGARYLAEKNYQYNVILNWLSRSTGDVQQALEIIRKKEAKNKVLFKSPFQEIPKRLWSYLAQAAQLTETHRWGDVSNMHLKQLSSQLTNAIFNANGKSTFKEEFVTAGGVDLKEINFKRFESKILPNIFLAGEVLNIDAVTGGFNFQNAWTGGYIIGKSLNL
ncbi:NAD(P)/FAD-dependent oxidoreductase [Flavobacteriaceae bacterium F08102]|nr:NAD(P)/FAD-dependent oxidoreductase [Flavobacteriaceae bacterium F08102]